MSFQTMKNEQSRGPSQQTTTTIQSLPQMARLPPLPLPLPQPPLPTASNSSTTCQRFIDSNAIDITSIKGQFAWEKIPHSDTCIPVIFRNQSKYFCVRMLRQLLPDYSEDVLRQTVQYQYRKSIPICNLTKSEIELINRINSHHCRWSYSRQPFTANDELVRVADFIPFYEHLRHGGVRTISMHANVPVRQIIQQQTHNKPMQRPNEYLDNHMPSILSVQRLSAPLNLCPSTANLSRETILSTVRPSVSTAVNQIRPQTQLPPNPYVPQVRPQIIQSQQQIQPAPSLTNVVSRVPNTPSTSSPDTPSCLAAPPPPTTTVQRKQSIPSLATKPSRPICGWLQVNQLYTPYITTTSATNHHLYRLPVSLLSFYHLLKTSSSESSESKEVIFPFEQTPATSEELELINKLCTQQNIQPFCSDTKLIDLVTFYEHSSANLLFVKELSLTEPKSNISRDWPSIVKINGGICRLRNTTTLNEQTVPFIGNNLIKTFVLSSQTLSTAKLTKPTDEELEFLQMILFFTNMSINLTQMQLIDIETVQKEYNVDLILLFNDKFPLNVLNYQQQGTRTNPSQPSALRPSTTTAPTNTITESTPPPSPPSPVPAPAPTTTAPVQFPLQPSANRFNKIVDFHGHSLTAFVCSGLDTTAQRHCVSVKSLCEILFPHSPMIDRIEIKMLKVLRTKNINRFRPQTQTALGFTRLIDIQDAEKYWDEIERDMRAIVNVDNQRATIRSSTSTEESRASTVIESNVEPTETQQQPMVMDRGEKRVMETSDLADEDVPVMERLTKRMKTTEKENQAVTKTDNQVRKITIKIPVQTKKKPKRTVPSNRTNKDTQANWVKKYNLDECTVLLNPYNPIYDDGTA